MIDAFIFLLHGIFLLIAFFYRKNESIGDRILAMAFVAIVFSVGWVITNMLTDAAFHITWFHDWYWHLTDTKPMLHYVQVKEFRQDTLSLMLLTFGEVIFYYIFFLEKKPSSSPKEEQNDNPLS